ncbi:hypothetical protein SNE40_019254 [Patella caerulea]|uniref:Meteorin-like protein n=1 Tax=Patella caerulea TaxID=87958 RepID=A0AAN8P9Y6_PATCE
MFGSISLSEVLLILVTVCFVRISAEQDCNGCDCLVRDNVYDERANINVKPSCQEGKVTWMNPTNAIRLDLQPSIPGEFKACILVISESVTTLVSRELSEPTVSNYRRQTLENKMSLQPWFTAVGQGKEYCVTSSENSVLLYLEIEATTMDSGLSRVTIYYDLEIITSLTQPSPMEDCRPCDDEELLKSFCSSEFVVVGSMMDVTDQSELGKTRITIDVEQVIRQKDGEFNRASGKLEGPIFAPVHCDIRKGPGVFLFTGRSRLGHSTLTCAPFYEDWLRILKSAKESGALECSVS